jgi:hypothetical protein
MYADRLALSEMEKEVNKTHIKNMLSEYFSCSCVIGFDINNEISIIWNVSNAKDNSSLENVLMDTCQSIVLAKNVRQQKREQKRNENSEDT